MGGDKDYFIIGKILKPFGVSGEVKVLPITDNVERFKDIPFIYIKKYNTYVKVPVSSSRIADRFALLKLSGALNRDDVDKYRGKYLYIDRENAVNLEKNSYYYYDILECRVVTTEGVELGVVDDIKNAGSCDIYVVKLKDREDVIMIPAISDVVKKIDIRSKKIEIKLLDGLI